MRGVLPIAVRVLVGGKGREEEVGGERTVEEAPLPYALRFGDIYGGLLGGFNLRFTLWAGPC